MTVIKDLEGRYGNLGSALVRQDGCYYVVSSSDFKGHPQTHAFPATRTGRVTSWREVCGDYGMTLEEVIAELGKLVFCRWCGEIIRREGRRADRSPAYATTDPNNGHPWWCGSDPDESRRRHEPRERKG